MKCKILHESKGRMRVHLFQNYMTLEQADILEYYLKTKEGILEVKVFDRTRDVIITFRNRENVIRALSKFSYQSNDLVIPEHTGRVLLREYEDKLFSIIAQRMVFKLFLPSFLNVPIVLFKSAFYIIKGLKSLYQWKLDVSVLDATAILVSILRGDTETASSVMFMLKIGETLEEWTHKKSVEDLARTMALGIDNVWIRNKGQESLVPIYDVKVGDHMVVHTGNMIALDGIVLSGEAMVNQSSITGESMPVKKEEGSYVYAGTVIEEGSCVIYVEKNSGDGRYDKIVKMIEDSEKLKSKTEDKATHLADRLVPFSLGGTILTYLFTRNVTKALSILMVDFSCALKLAMPIAVLSAMRESNLYHISVKGGKYLEAIAEADMIVFDKTGTLTHANPTVAKIVTFDERSKKEMLRIAACLEEHYPHSMANAVVAEAVRRDLHHEECHSQVEYVVAHGISSMIDGEKVIIGSYHFVFQDEGCVIPKKEREKFEQLPEEYSHLYMAISGRLAAVICIKDPLREESKAVINTLRCSGIKHIVMMTGDNEKTAKAVATAVGIEEYYANVLPEDKANFIAKKRLEGMKVIMIGDGVNDTPALSQADAGIAISDGAAIAREIADITISADDLYALVTLKWLGDSLMRRIGRNYHFIISFNMMLILLGASGVIQPTTSALLHNLSTLGVSLKSMTNLLE